MTQPLIPEIFQSDASNVGQQTPAWLQSHSTLESLDKALTELRRTKDLEINAARLQANETHFFFKNKKIACDKVSKDDIVNTSEYISNNNGFHPKWPGGWKAMDNTFVPITTLQEWKDFHSALYDQGIRNFLKAQWLKQQLTKVNTVQEILDISWKTPTPYDDPVV